MFEKPSQKQERAEGSHLAGMSEEQLNAELATVSKRILVVEGLLENPGMAQETLLEERRKLDAQKAEIRTALDNLEDPFSRAVGANGQETVLRRMEQGRGGQPQ